MRLACWFRRRAETIFSKKLKVAWSATGPEKFAIARRVRQHARRMRYLENARKSSATSGYFAASASTSPVSTWTSSPPGHSSLKIERRTSTVQLRRDLQASLESLMDIEPEISNNKNRTSVIDVIAHDPKTGEAVLIMNEPNEWDDSDEQLLSLQERFNAYVSFLLDGEMESGHPELAGKPARIEVRCTHMPDSRALELLGLIHDQLAFQDIKMEVVIRNDETRISNDEGMTKSE
jgi:hypothetical protein